MKRNLVKIKRNKTTHKKYCEQTLMNKLTGTLKSFIETLPIQSSIQLSVLSNISANGIKNPFLISLISVPFQILYRFIRVPFQIRPKLFSTSITSTYQFHCIHFHFHIKYPFLLQFLQILSTCICGPRFIPNLYLISPKSFTDPSHT